MAADVQAVLQNTERPGYRVLPEMLHDAHLLTLATSDLSCRDHAIYWLNQLKLVPAGPIVVRPDDPTLTRLALIELLTGADAADADALFAIADSAAPEVRIAVAHRLADRDDPRALTVLWNSLARWPGVIRVRRDVAAWQEAPNVPPAQGRQALAEVMRRFGDLPAAAASALAGLAEGARRIAFESLAACQVSVPGQALAPIATDLPEVLLPLIACLSRSQSAPAEVHLQALLKHEREDIQIAACKALSVSGTADSVGALTPLAKAWFGGDTARAAKAAIAAIHGRAKAGAGSLALSEVDGGLSLTDD